MLQQKSSEKYLKNKLSIKKEYQILTIFMNTNIIIWDFFIIYLTYMTKPFVFYTYLFSFSFINNQNVYIYYLLLFNFLRKKL